MIGWNERPPILSGDSEKDMAAIRDYLFRLSGKLTELIMTVDAVVTVDKDGRITLKKQ